MVGVAATPRPVDDPAPAGVGATRLRHPAGPGPAAGRPARPTDEVVCRVAGPPPLGGPQPYTPPPPNRLALAILCTIFCFTPFGIVAIVKATSVNSLWAQGRWGEAYRTSRSVKNWCIFAALAWPGSALLFACTGMLGML